MTRRQLIGSAVAAGGAVALSGGSSVVGPESADAAVTLPAPGSSGIDHVVVVMMENRSFDHFMGWLPGADGKQAGLSYVDRYGVSRSTYHLTEFASCGHTDPDHSQEGGLIQLNGGKADGWLRAGEDDLLPIGYYQQSDLAFLGQAAPAWTDARCSNHVPLLDDRHLDSLAQQYMVYFNDARPHQGIEQMVPANRTLKIDTTKPIEVTPVLGGLHADYRRAA